MKINPIASAVSLSLSFMFLSACGGSSSEPEPEPVVLVPPPQAKVTGLTMPPIISILTDEGEETPLSKSNLNAKPFDDADSDYTNDPVRSYVWDESMGPMQMVNQILCYVGQTRADELVNETYTALVDTARCERESGGSDDSGQSSSNSETEYQLWTVESTRDSAESPQRVRIWVPSENSDGDDPMDQQNILVEVTLNSSPSDELPFGDFNMNWKGVLDQDGNEISTMQGTLQTVENQDGKLQFMFYNGADVPAISLNFSEAANVILDDANGTSGTGKTATHRVDPNFEFHSEFSVAYDPTRFFRGNDRNNDNGIDSQSCYNRLSMEENVWRYNLYQESDGSRVSINSGFPFETQVGDERLNGYMSYWGMWLPGGIDKNSVTSITQQDFSDDATDTQYDVLHSPGRLIKRTKSTIALEGLDGNTFIYFNDGESIVEYVGDFILNDGTQVGVNGFYQVATIEFFDNQRQITTITPSLIEHDFIHMYSETLQGSVAYDRQADAANIVAFQQEFITGNDESLFGSNAEVTFACYNDCLKSGLTTAQLEHNGDSPYLVNSDDPSVPAALYTFNLIDMTLRNAEGEAIAMADNQAPSENGTNSWGINTGAMVLEGTALTNVWDAWNQEVSYQWETGPNEWNQMTFVSPEGTDEFVQFDRPMQFMYAHSDANDRNIAADETGEFDGQSFLLEYGGAGNLWGIPDVQSDNGRYERAFSLKDATQLTNASGDYVIKATELEKHMRELELASCSEGDNALSLTAAQEIELPSADDVLPITFNLADKPEVDDAPKVVGGEIVGD